MNRRGVTLIEISITLAAVGIMAGAVASVFVPQMNFFFYFSRNVLAQNAGADLLQTLSEGDLRARGLRFAGPPCVFPAGGSADAISSASRTAITYHYADASHCYAGSGTGSRSVTVTYDPASQSVTRSVDGGAARALPDYVPADGEINFDEIENNSGGDPAFFRYYDSAGAEMDEPVAAGDLDDIHRVDVAFRVLTGTGNVRDDSASVYMESGVEIKRYTA